MHALLFQVYLINEMLIGERDPITCRKWKITIRVSYTLSVVGPFESYRSV